LLSRKWKGRTLLVEVLADGFRFKNRHYTSLSAIAVAITGTRWNGLAFFGLTGKGRWFSLAEQTLRGVGHVRGRAIERA
jgi:hypothetical protein